MSITVKLKKRQLKSGRISLYLSYSPGFYDYRTNRTVTAEKLNLFLVSDPTNATERKHNRDVEELAFGMLSKRILQIRNEEFGFIDHSLQEEDFLAFFENMASDRGSKWDAAFKHFRKFCGGHCSFGMLSAVVCKKFRNYLLKDARCARTGKQLHQNSASVYLSVFRVVLKEAYESRMIGVNLNDFFSGIMTEPTRKEYLTDDEFRRLSATPCRCEVLKKASMFAVFTGLRFSDIKDLEWKHITRAADGGWCVSKKIQKSRRHEIIFISEEALSFCSPTGEGLVFQGLKYSQTRYHFKKWLNDAGIKKDLSFHCLRHTSATLMHEHGVDIYTVSKMLGHRNVKTTMVYAEVVDGKKREAANSITLKDFKNIYK